MPRKIFPGESCIGGELRGTREVGTVFIIIIIIVISIAVVIIVRITPLCKGILRITINVAGYRTAIVVRFITLIISGVTVSNISY